jgi:hypothetical protein
MSEVSKHCTIFSDLGAHIDGFIAVVAHTIVVGASKSNPVGNWLFLDKKKNSSSTLYVGTGTAVKKNLKYVAVSVQLFHCRSVNID